MRERNVIEAVVQKLEQLPIGSDTQGTATLLIVELLLDIRDQNERIIRHLNVMHPHDVP
jgi:hypothetical protein